MKPLVFWEMEAVFIFTGIMILLIGIVLGILGAILIDRTKPKQKKSAPLRWTECNGVDLNCPMK